MYATPAPVIGGDVLYADCRPPPYPVLVQQSVLMHPMNGTQFSILMGASQETASRAEENGSTQTEKASTAVVAEKAQVDAVAKYIRDHASTLASDVINQPKWVHTEDRVHAAMRTLQYLPKGVPKTLGENLTYTLELPGSTHTAIWLLPLIDGRLWYGEPPRGTRGELFVDTRTKKEYPDGKPDNQNTPFADWDVKNILGLKPPEMLCTILVPTLVGWIFSICLQIGFIYYIAQGVILLKWPNGNAETTTACFGASGGDEGSLKTAHLMGPRVLRLICNLTFCCEIVKEMVEAWQYHEWYLPVSLPCALFSLQ